MLVCAVVSLKGGVGKTTVTLGLTGAAQRRGLNVLVIDLDPQANASTSLDPQGVAFTSNDVLADGRPGLLEQAVSPSSWTAGAAKVGVVVAEPALEHRIAIPLSDNDLTGARQQMSTLRRAMSGLSGWDLVLIDCPPSLGMLTRNALAAANGTLVVVEPGVFAVQGAHRALDAVEVVRRHANLALRPWGLAVNRVRRTAEQTYRLAELEQAYRSASDGGLVLDPVLPDRAVLQQAQGACLPVQVLPGAPAREVSAVFSRWLDHLLSQAAPAVPAGRSGWLTEPGVGQ